MRFFFVLSVALFLCVFGVWRVQAMGSVNYQIPWDTLNTGGDESSTSTNFRLYDTVGQTATGFSSSTSYQVEGGYRASSDLFRLSFTVGGQSPSFATRYVRFDNVDPDYIVVSSTVGLVSGDYIAAVQDVGYSALVATARVIGIAGDIVTVDDWQGDAVMMDGFSSDNNDYVYELNSTTIPLGTVTATVGSGSVGLAGGSVISSASSGHTVYVQADGDLALISGGAVTISPVADGVVSAGSEEYGAEAIGAYAVSPGVDLAVTSTQRAIISSTVPAATTAERFALLFKLGVTPSTAVGDYRQTVYFTLTSNF